MERMRSIRVVFTGLLPMQTSKPFSEGVDELPPFPAGKGQMSKCWQRAAAGNFKRNFKKYANGLNLTYI